MRISRKKTQPRICLDSFYSQSHTIWKSVQPRPVPSKREQFYPLGSNPCALVGKRHSLGYASIVSIHKVIQSGKVFSHDQSLPNENSFTLLLLVLIASGLVGRFQQWSESRNETQVWCFQSISMLCLDIIPC